MRVKSTVMLTTVLAAALVASTVSAQSLAEVARRDRAQRKATKAHGHVYTNADLKPVPGDEQSSGAAAPASGTQASTSKTPGAKAPAAATSAAGSATAKAAGAASKAAAKPVKKGRTYWHKRITTARAALAQTKVLLSGMESRINALAAEFSARDDPIQRAQIQDDRIKALAELARLKKQAKAQTKAIADIQEAARRAGVPPGWLR